ncbi:hypothetical protein M3P05_09425 [Sansalvadorimonas sp. 2012CJ34-2]|uniref:DNA mismatch repair proteins mutS family domain-containing protein n=1 Tax=Parendozoicomonas callyspongiae TaxID=2942213 RepID=A0ABT0PFJ9_9GAMM|nr:hypothetical protein [Sansalvadorimonas sp. 2012CJ34-2]MCL6270152.1 hypothetical protein [Sansalvadorimonas sp. 2012CJ34-2]
MKTITKGSHILKTLGFIISVVGLSSSVAADLRIDNSYELISNHLPEAYPYSALSFQDMSLKESLDHPEIILTARQKREIMLSALKDQPGDKSNTVLTHHAVKDLKLLKGTTLNPDKSLLNRIGQTASVSGEIMLANALITPTDDINQLKLRQQALQYLLDNPGLCSQLSSLLRRYAGDEDGVITLFDPSDIINTSRAQDIESITQSIFPISSSTAFEVSRRFGELGYVFQLSNLALSTTAAISANIYVQLYSMTGNAWTAFKMLPKTVPRVIKAELSQNSIYTNLALAGGMLVAQGLITYQLNQLSKAERNAYLFIFERARRPGRSLSAAKKIADLLNKHPALTDALTLTSNFNAFKTSPNIQELTNLLDSAPDKSPDAFSYYVTNMGRYKRGINLLRNNKDQLLAITQATGEVDAWLTVANFVKENQEGNNKLTFASYEETQTPSAHLTNYWNPHLPPDIAVPSTVNLGNGSPRSLLVTGPNAAGKSTAIEGIAISSILAQTFGIAPSEGFKLTPFSLIHTHMDISAEVAAGLSSFQAESQRAIELMDKLQTMQPGQFSLAIMDEIFSSTNPVEGEAGTYGYLKSVSGYPHAINVCTTHYSRPVLLASHIPDRFQNMHVDAFTGQSGKLGYDYYLKPGSSQQRVAIQVLKEKGIQSDFLNTANDVIIHPEKY